MQASTEVSADSKPGCQVVSLCAQSGQGAEVTPGRPPGQGDERRVTAVLGDVLSDPGDGPLAVDDVVRPGGLGAEPVVDGDADPAPGDQLVEHGLALLALVPDDPGAAVDVDHDRRRGHPGREPLRTDDVEAVPMTAVAPVVDVPGQVGRASTDRDGPGEAPPPAPLRPGDLHRRQRRAGGGAQGLGHHGAGPLSNHGQTHQPGPTGGRQDQAEVSGPGREGAEEAEDHGARRLDHDRLDGQLPHHPPPEEAEDGERLAAHRAVGVEDQKGAQRADPEKDVGHVPIIARPAPVVPNRAAPGPGRSRTARDRLAPGRRSCPGRRGVGPWGSVGAADQVAWRLGGRRVSRAVSDRPGRQGGEMTTERLSGLDASFLYMETPTLHMHVAMTAVFDPSTVPDGYSFRRLRQLIDDRLPLIPVFTRRLVEVPFRLGHPIWVDDPDFDIDNHLRRAALPAPGGMRELGEFAADVDSRQLHRDRPLWEMWLVEGLEGGKIALVVKMHHSTIDGVSGAELLGILFDLEPSPAAQPDVPEPVVGRIPSDFELVSQAMVARLLKPLEITRMLWRTGQSLLGVRRVRLAGSNRGALPLTAPRTSINVAITSRRRVAFAAAGLADVKRLKNEMGTTVNDVVLAMCTGALRNYLLAGDELPVAPLVSVVPVSVSPVVADLKGSNRVSAMFVPLPTHEPDPLERLRLIHEGTRGAKEEHNALGADTLKNWAEHATPNTFALAARLYTGMRLADRHRPIANLVISNVPGPDIPLYLGGAEMLAGFPLGPVMDGMGLNITIMSYRGVLYWGLVSCARAVPRLWDIAAAVPAALDELLAAAGIAPEPFDLALHLGPGMPGSGAWSGRPDAGAARGAAASNGRGEATPGRHPPDAGPDTELAPSG